MALECAAVQSALLCDDFERKDLEIFRTLRDGYSQRSVMAVVAKDSWHKQPDIDAALKVDRAKMMVIAGMRLAAAWADENPLLITKDMRFRIENYLVTDSMTMLFIGSHVMNTCSGGSRRGVFISPRYQLMTGIILG